MQSASTVVEVAFEEYRKQFLRTLVWSTEKLDDVLEEQPEGTDSEGLAAVADTVEHASETFESSPDQLLQLFMSKLADEIGADPETTLLTRHAIRALIEDLVDGAPADALLIAVQRGRTVLTDLAVQDLPSAGQAIGILEGLLEASGTEPELAGARNGRQLARAWFDQQSSGPTPTNHSSEVGRSENSRSDVVEVPVLVVGASRQVGGARSAPSAATGPSTDVAHPPAPPQRDYTVLAVVATVISALTVFGLVTGIIAIIYCNTAKHLYRLGDDSGGYKAQRTAKILTFVTFGILAFFVVGNLIRSNT